FYDVDMYADAEKLVKALEAIESRYTRRLLPCLYETYTYRQQNLLVNQEEIINKVNDKGLRISLIKMCLHATNDLLVPLSYGLDQSYIEEALENVDLKPVIEPMALQQNSLQPFS